MDPPAHPPPSPGPIGVHMFQGARNLTIQGGQFGSIARGSTDEADLTMVYNMAAPNAILNAGGRADEVRCHPGTREEVIAKSEAWMDLPADQQVDDSQKGIFWLSGPAGAGKSAVVQTLAERRQARGLPMVNFFFFRNDSTRSNAGPLVATILFQLVGLYPGLKPLISAVLRKKPDIFRESLRDQFHHLIDLPVRAVCAVDPSLTHIPIVLLIDGLDECDSKDEQQALLKVLHDLVTSDNSPFRVYVASRSESHLVMTFNELGCSSKSIFLDDQYQPEADIRLFVIAELARIKGTHHLGYTLGKTWPAEDHINMIVAKSSGQFIFAATVIRFIAGAAASPAVSLDEILGLRPVNRTSPFAELDATYIYILSQVDDWELTKDILTAKVLRDIGPDSVKLYSYLYPLGYGRGHVSSCVLDLMALAKSTDSGELEFYHASLPDFLCDETRSGDYYIDVKGFCGRWAEAFLRCIRDDDSLRSCGHVLQHTSGPSSSITNALTAPPIVGSEVCLFSETAACEFMGHALYEYCRHDEQLFEDLVRRWAAWFRKHGTSFQDFEADDPRFPVLSSILMQLEPEFWDKGVRISRTQSTSRETLPTSSTGIIGQTLRVPTDKLRVFVAAAFGKIKHHHSLGSSLPEQWPPEDQIDKIVEKSSGQFLYPETLLRFISESPEDPNSSLLAVLNNNLSTDNSSFPSVEPDGIYIYILSQVQEWASANLVLTAQLFLDLSWDTNWESPRGGLYQILDPFGFDGDEILSSISDLAALLAVDKKDSHYGSIKIMFHHNSVVDFLRDPTRSRDFYIDLDAFANRAAEIYIQDVHDYDSLATCYAFLQCVSQTDALITNALTAGPTHVSASTFSPPSMKLALDFLSTPLYSYCTGDLPLYTLLVPKWVSWFHKNGLSFNYNELSSSKIFKELFLTVKQQLGGNKWQEIISAVSH